MNSQWCASKHKTCIKEWGDRYYVPTLVKKLLAIGGCWQEYGLWRVNHTPPEEDHTFKNIAAAQIGLYVLKWNKEDTQLGG